MSKIVLVGLDWTAQSHAGCVVDDDGRMLDRFEVPHGRDGLTALRRRPSRFGVRLRIAIELPSGLIVDALVDAGHEVVPIHPNALKACRPHYRCHGGKSNAGDAYIFADVLLTNGHRWRALCLQSDGVQALRALVRARDDLVAMRVALSNQLRSVLEAFWPGAACIFADIASPIGQAFLKRYPSSASAARLAEQQLQTFCKRQHYCGRRTPAELLGRLRSAGGQWHRRARCLVARRALAGRCPAAGGRADRRAHAAHRGRRRGVTRWPYPHFGPARRAYLRRADAVRTRRRTRAFPERRATRCRGWRDTGHLRIG